MSTINLNEADWDLPVDLPIETRVKQGLMLLDEKYGPEWVHRIDVDQLHLGLTCRCVLGQLEGNYYDGADKVFGEHNVEDDPADYGFTLRPGIQPVPWSDLTAAWKHAILARRAELSS